MSGHGDPHEEAHDDDGHEHDDDHHAPAPLPEPVTPLWLTLLGVGLFLVAGIWFVATGSEGKTKAELTAVPTEGAAPAAPGAAPAPAAPGAAPAPAQRLNAPPNPPSAP